MTEQPVEFLLENIGYVVVTYDDNTKRIIRTTLNEKILQKNGVFSVPDGLYDLDRNRTIPLGKSVNIFGNLPTLDPLNTFINQFL